jgi:hypothetical protein
MQHLQLLFPPSGLAELFNFPQDIKLSISRLVCAAPPKVDPTISAIC